MDGLLISSTKDSIFLHLKIQVRKVVPDSVLQSLNLYIRSGFLLRIGCNMKEELLTKVLWRRKVMKPAPCHWIHTIYLILSNWEGGKKRTTGSKSYGGDTDTMPYWPQPFSFDVSLYNANLFYGNPEHVRFIYQFRLSEFHYRYQLILLFNNWWQL